MNKNLKEVLSGRACIFCNKKEEKKEAINILRKTGKRCAISYENMDFPYVFCDEREVNASRTNKEKKIFRIYEVKNCIQFK